MKYTVEAHYNRSAVPEASKEQLNKAGIAEDKHESINKVRAKEQHVPTSLTVSAVMLVKDKKGEFKKESKVLFNNKSITNEVKTELKDYEVGKGEAKENVSLLNSSVEEIVKNTGQLALNVKAIRNIAIEIKKQNALHRYDQIVAEIDNQSFGAGKKARLKATVEAFKNARNVTLN